MVEIIRKYWGLLLIGLALRLVIAGITFHPDVTTPAVTSAVVFREGALNFYEDAPRINPQEVLDDLPLSYLISLPFHIIARPLVSEDIETTFFFNRSVLFGSPVFWIYLIYIKFPLILFDLAVGVLLALTLVNFQKRVLFFWIFNPITLWATSAIGQLDIYLVFFITLAYFFAKKGYLNWAALSLGAGGAIKSTPFLLVPLLLGLAKNWKERISIIILACLPYLVTVIPYLGSSEFRQNALFAPQLSKVFFASFPLSGAESILVVPTILLLLYLLFFSRKRDVSDFLHFSIAILLSILVFTHFHMQWFLWVTPFLFIWFVDNWRGGIQLAIWLLLVSWLLMLFLFESSLQVKLFAPFFPGLDWAIGLKEILPENQGTFLRNIAASIFAASSGFLVWKLLRDNQ